MMISPAQASRILLVAALYNGVWGALVVLFPRWSFELSGMPAPHEAIFLWQCIGMIVGVYGVGYLIASVDPFRHWPIVLVGLLGKIFGPIGFVYALLMDQVSLGFLVHILPNDLVWWIPFGLILVTAAKRYLADEGAPVDEQRLFQLMTRTLDGGAVGTVDEISRNRPTLVVFLRHAGCCFARELLAEVTKTREQIEREASIVLVTMEQTESYRRLIKQFTLESCLHAVDPAAEVYRAIGLRRMPLRRLFGFREWYRGIAAVLRFGIGGLAGDGWMPSGSVLVQNGKILRRSLTTRASEQPELCLVPGV